MKGHAAKNRCTGTEGTSADIPLTCLRLAVVAKREGWVEGKGEPLVTPPSPSQQLSASIRQQRATGDSCLLHNPTRVPGTTAPQSMGLDCLLHDSPVGC